MDVIRFVYTSVHLSAIQSVLGSVSQSTNPSVKTSIICTILFEFYEYSDHFIVQYISSSHLTQAKSSVKSSSVLFEQTSQKIK